MKSTFLVVAFVTASFNPAAAQVTKESDPPTRDIKFHPRDVEHMRRPAGLKKDVVHDDLPAINEMADALRRKYRNRLTDSEIKSLAENVYIQVRKTQGETAIKIPLSSKSLISEATRDETGVFKIMCDPKQAEIYIGMAYINTTNSVILVQAGTVTLTLKKRGYMDFVKSYDVTGGQVIAVSETLTKQ